VELLSHIVKIRNQPGVDFWLLPFSLAAVRKRQQVGGGKGPVRSCWNLANMQLCRGVALRVPAFGDFLDDFG
jgi:hypothetical protein